MTRVFGGDPGSTDGRSRETAAVSVLEEQVLRKQQKALIVYGAAHSIAPCRRTTWPAWGRTSGLRGCWRRHIPAARWS